MVKSYQCRHRLLDASEKRSFICTPTCPPQVFSWYVAWRIAIGVAIFHYELERIEMLDHLHDFAMRRRPGGSWSYYFLLDHPDILRAYLIPLIAWWIGGALIVDERDGTVTPVGILIFLIAALPWIACYAFCAFTLAMGVGLIAALLVSLTTILGPLYIVEMMMFFGFIGGVIWAISN
jgi:hypothetical protein